jgi:hypothetical protein
MGEDWWTQTEGRHEIDGATCVRFICSILGVPDLICCFWNISTLRI